MKRYGIGLAIAALLLGAGCVERRLKINTSPTAAQVILNDEQIGPSPVTVTFQWYGDYNVRISKVGCQTLDTHRALKAPWYDTFPFDFFAQVVWPGRIVDSYEWTFVLQARQPVDREDLIRKGQVLQQQLEAEAAEL